MFGISLARISLLTGTPLGGGVGVSPTLDLNFRGQGYSAAMTAYTFDQIIDFTRTSAATYVANTGFVTQTPASRNLLTYTQEFDNAAWVKTGAAAYPFDPAMASYGPELVTNGDFSSADGWGLVATSPATASISGGKLTISSPAGETSLARQTIVSAGKWYRISGSVTIRSGSMKIIVGGGPTEYNFTSTQSFSFFAPAGSSNGFFDISRATIGSNDFDVDNISVKEVIGGLITAPDDTLTADALVATAGSSIHRVLGNGAVAGSQQAFSVYAKVGTHRYLQVNSGANSQLYANFDLLTGTVGNVGTIATAFIESVGNGWYRCGFIGTPATITGMRATLITSATAAHDESWNATGTESLYLWGAQIEVGSTATSYTRNFGGLYPPRFDYDPVTLAPRGLLVEEQRTNLLLRSEEFNNAVWVKGTATVTANATTSPDGTVDADKVIVNTGVALGTSTAAGIRQSVSKAASAITYTYTAYLKVGEFNSAFLWMSNAGVTASVRCTFNLAAGTASATTTTGSFTGASATITAVGNGWYRCTLIATSDTDTTVRCDIWPSDTVATTGDGTSGIYLWGAQLEPGAFPTSYIPTVASQVTRTADVAAVTGTNFSRWYNQSEGTLVVEAATQKPSSLAATVIAIDASDGSVNNRHYIGAVSTSAEVRTVNGGSVQSLLNQAYSANSVEKYAYAVKANNFAFARNGSIVGTDTSGSMPTIDRMFVGNAAGSAAFWNGHIRRIRYYPTRLSNTQLQALTA